MFGSFHSVAMLCVSLMLAFTSAAASPTPLLISQPYYSFFYFPYGRYDTAGINSTGSLRFAGAANRIRDFLYSFPAEFMEPGFECWNFANGCVPISNLNLFSFKIYFLISFRWKNRAKSKVELPCAKFSPTIRAAAISPQVNFIFLCFILLHIFFLVFNFCQEK